MEELLTKALVIRTTNYQDSDKIITLFSLEHGKIAAKLRGVRKQNAKLKFAGQIFCLAEFCLLKTGETFSVKTASEIENFFNLTQNFDHLMTGTLILEICDKVLDKTNAKLFLNTLKALDSLSNNNANPKIVAAKYFLEVFADAGYKLLFENCKSCGKNFDDDVFLNVETGAFVCGACVSNECMSVSNPAFLLLKTIDKIDFEKLHTLKASDKLLDELLVVLNANFSGKFDYVLKSLKKL